MSEFLTEKKLFQETFGGTTFNHFIEWCKKMDSASGHTRIFIKTLNPQEDMECIDYSITRPNRVFFIEFNNFVRRFTINTIEDYMDLDKYFDRKCKEFGCDKYTIKNLKKDISYFTIGCLQLVSEDRFLAPAVSDFFKNSDYIIKKRMEKIIKLKQKRQKIWNETYIKFKGIDTDIFTPVYEYEMPYDGSFLFNGDDSRRIEFISIIVKHIDFVNKVNKWVVDPKSIKVQILNFGDIPVATPATYISLNEYK